MSAIRTLVASARELVTRLAAGRALTNARVINGIYDEATTKATPDARPAQSETPDLITGLAASFASVWTLPRVVSREARRRLQLRTALEAAYAAYVRQQTAARMFLTRIELPHLLAEYEAVAASRFTATTAVRTHQLPAIVYFVTIAMVTVVDFQFFFSLLMDVQVASPSDPGFWGMAVQSAGIALLTPVAVIIVGEWGGRRAARLRHEAREWLDAGGTVRTLPIQSLLVPAVMLIALLVLVLLFFVFALHRFEEFTSRPGALQVAPALLALLIALLPVVAFGASLFHHDLAGKHRATIMRRWEATQATMTRNQTLVSEAMSTWTVAWGALSDQVGRMVAEANVSVQTFEHLVLMGLARANQRGLTAYTLASVIAPASTVAPVPVTESGQLSVVLPARQVATKLSSAEFVLDELMIDLQWLIRFLPRADEMTEREVVALLRLAHPTASAFGAAQATTDADSLERMYETPASPPLGR